MLLVNRFRTSSLLGLLVVVAVSAAMNFSVSHAHYELSTTLASEELFVMGSNVHEASTNLQNKEGGTAINKARMSNVKGRKMMIEIKEMEKDVIMKKEEVKKGLEYASKISGANYSVGKCEHKKEGEIRTIGRRLSRRSNKSNLLPYKTNVGGRHISLNADYHVPRPHPPKNN